MVHPHHMAKNTHLLSLLHYIICQIVYTCILGPSMSYSNRIFIRLTPDMDKFSALLKIESLLCFLSIMQPVLSQYGKIYFYLPEAQNARLD